MVGLRFEAFDMRSALFWVCLLLAGCATIEKQTAPVGPIGEDFYLSGRVSVKPGPRRRVENQLATSPGQRRFAAFGSVWPRRGPHRPARRSGDPYHVGSKSVSGEGRRGSDRAGAGLAPAARRLARLGARPRGRRRAGANAAGWLASPCRIEAIRLAGGIPRLQRRQRPARTAASSRDDAQIRLAIDQWRAEP